MDTLSMPRTRAFAKTESVIAVSASAKSGVALRYVIQKAIVLV